MQAVELGDGLQGVQQSKLADAFGPEGEELQGNEGTPGKAERVQIGDALVALLESHRKHRFFPTAPCLRTRIDLQRTKCVLHSPCAALWCLVSTWACAWSS